MAWGEDYEADGCCESCGDSLDDGQPEWHRLCWACWHNENDDEDERPHSARERRPPPGTVNQTALGAVIALGREVHELRLRIEKLEQVAVDLTELARVERQRRWALDVETRRGAA
jgi:hypothetical protein